MIIFHRLHRIISSVDVDWIPVVWEEVAQKYLVKVGCTPVPFQRLIIRPITLLSALGQTKKQTDL